MFSHTATLHSAGLDTPQITELMQRLADKGYDVPRDVLDVEGGAEAIAKILKEKKK